MEIVPACEEQANGSTTDAMSLACHSAWRPRWTVDVGHDCVLGIAVDDGCFVVLYPHGDIWRPGTHIPKEAAAKIADLLNGNRLG